MRKSRAVLAVMMITAIVLLPSWALAAERTLQTPALDLHIRTHTEDGYKVDLSVDPMKLLRLKTGAETYWFTPVDNGKVKIEIDPIFVVGS